MLKQFFISSLLVGLTSCAHLGTSMRYSYDLDRSSKLSDEYGELTIDNFGSKRLDFSFKNNSKSSGKILWDESVLVDVNGNSRRVLHNGVKYIDASRSTPPTTIPPGGLIKDFVSYADGIQMIGATWIEEMLVPCSESGQLCDATQNYGKSITFMLTADFEGKKRTYQAKMVMKKKEEPVKK